MRSPSWFKPEINANFLLTCAALVVSTSGLYYGLSGRLDQQEVKMALATTRQDEIDKDQTKKIENGQAERRAEMLRLEGQVRAVEQKTDQKLESVQRDLLELKGTTREINANLQWIIRQQSGNLPITIPPPPR